MVLSKHPYPRPQPVPDTLALLPLVWIRQLHRGRTSAAHPPSIREQLGPFPWKRGGRPPEFRIGGFFNGFRMRRAGGAPPRRGPDCGSRPPPPPPPPVPRRQRKPEHRIRSERPSSAMIMPS